MPSVNPISGRPWPRDAQPSWHARLTSGSRCLPNLLVIGAQKAGTTSLHAHLGEHDDIWMTPLKECNALTAGPPNMRRYRACFLRRREQSTRYVGESTPYYLFHPAAPGRAARLLPEVRAIAILRDPAARAWSHYRHNVRLGLEPLDFIEALDAEAERTAAEWDRIRGSDDAQSNFVRHYSYIARGRYAEQLERWQAAIGRERLFVCFADDLFERTAETLGRLSAFLDIPATFMSSLPTRNRGDDRAIPAPARERLEAAFAESNLRLAEVLDCELPWR